MEVTLGFTNVGEYFSVQTQLWSPTNLSGQAVTSILEVTSGYNSDAENLYALLYAYESAASSGAANPILSSYYTALTPTTSSTSNSGCVTLTMTMPSGPVTSGFYSNYQVGNGLFDPTKVSAIGIVVGTLPYGGGYGNTVVDIQNWI